MDTLQRNRKAFSAHAQGFSSGGETYADEAGRAWMLTDLPLSADIEALDIATGTGVKLQIEPDILPSSA